MTQAECGAPTDSVEVAEPLGWDGRTGRVAYVAKMFPRISETFILEEILALKRHGVPVKIYSILPPVRDGRIHPEAQELLPEVEFLGAPGPIRLGPLLSNLFECFRIRPAGSLKHAVRALISPHGARTIRRLERGADLAVRLRRDRIAHVHAAWAHGPASAARIASRLTGIPWSMGAHAKDLHLSHPRSIAKKIASARFTLACCAANRDLLVSLAPLDARGGREAEIALIHHGVDSVYFTPPHRRKGVPSTPVPLILSVGRLVPKKGFGVLLEAAALLMRRGLPFRLEIAGDGPERRRLEQTIKQLGLAEVVELRGMLVRQEVRDAFWRATCFALACRVTEDGDRDGIPNTLAEAMACALPVVSTRLPGVEEIVLDGETGVIVPPDDPQALADALAAVVEDPDRARLLGDRGRAWIERHFDAKQNGERRARRFARALGIERVLYVSADRGVPVRGHKGASVHVRSVVEGLSRMGVETRILTAREGPSDGPDPGVRVSESRSGPKCRAIVAWIARRTGGGESLERALLRLLDNASLYAEARRIAQTWKPDLVYERYALTAVAGAWLARHLRVPFVLEVNSPMVEEEQTFRGLRLGRLAGWIEGWLVRRADRVVVVSWALHAHALRQGALHERILVLPNAVDPKRFAASGDTGRVRARLGLDGCFVVGFCGSLKPWHGVGRLLEAAAIAASAVSGLRVLIVGDGPERGALESRARELGIRDLVLFTGSVSHEAVPGYLEASDLLAAPYEPMQGFYFSPLKVAEYLAVDRPVVVSAVGEIPHALDGVRGVTLVPPGDATALSRAIAEHARGGTSRIDPTRARKPDPWTWTDVVRRVLAAGEEARRELWSWKEPEVRSIACMLESFPAMADCSMLDQLLELERAGTRVTVFALGPSAETRPAPGVERLRGRVRIIRGPGGASAVALVTAHALQLLRSPGAYFAAAARAFGQAGRGGLSSFAFAPYVARTAREYQADTLLAESSGRVRAQAEVVSRLARIPMAAAPVAQTVSAGMPEARSS